MSKSLKSKIVNMIDESNEYVRDFLLNIILVKYEARNAYLFDNTHYVDEETISNLFKIVSDLGLFIKKDCLEDEHFCYWITREKLDKNPSSDEETGVLLGFKDPGGSFYDSKNKRLSLYINEEKTQTNIIAEIISGDKKDQDNIDYANDKVYVFNQLMSRIKLPYRFVYTFVQDDGTLKRLDELSNKNMRYVKKNREDYINDMENWIALEKNHPIIILFKRSMINEKLFETYFRFFLYIWRVINDKISSMKNDPESVKARANKKFIEILEESYSS